MNQTQIELVYEEKRLLENKVLDLLSYLEDMEWFGDDDLQLECEEIDVMIEESIVLGEETVE